jgi:hypothetical protein
MEQIKKTKTLEEKIILLQHEIKAQPISIGNVLRILSNKVRPLILIFLSLPFCFPIQIPGISTPFGLVIAFFGLRMAFGKYVWLPKGVLAKKIKVKTLKQISNQVLSLVKKTKPWIHPRLRWLCYSSFMKIMNGILIFLLGLLLSLPIPIPLSNLAPAWSIFFIAMGILEDDGAFVIIGYLIPIVVMFFYAISIFHLTSFLKT